jgi:hypothetical protein
MTKFDRILEYCIQDLTRPVDFPSFRDIMVKEGCTLTDERTEAVKERLDQSRYLFRAGGLYYPRWQILDHVCFYIRPSAFELENGVLIPAGRFLPFCSPQVLADRLTFISGAGEPRYSEMTVPPEVFRDWQLPPPDFQEGFPVPAADISFLYNRGPQWTENDVLSVSGLSWKNGIFSIERKTLPSGRDEAEKEWLNLWISGFNRAVREKNAPRSAADQVARAFFFAGEEVVSSPVMDLETSISRIPSLQHLWFFSRRYFGTLKAVPENGNSRPETLDALLDDHSCFFSRELGESFFRNDFYHNRESYRDSWGRIRDFLPEESPLRDSLERKFRPLWEDIREEYNVFRDRDTGRIRNYALEILESHRQWICPLLSRVGETGKPGEDPVAEVFRLSIWLKDLLVLLNEESFLLNNEVDEAFEALEGINMGLEDLRGRFPFRMDEK